MTAAPGHSLARSFASFYLHHPILDPSLKLSHAEMPQHRELNLHESIPMQSITEEQEVNQFYSAPENDAAGQVRPVTPPQRVVRTTGGPR